MAAVKHIPALGVILASTTVPAYLCHALHPDERTRCQLAPHPLTTLHQGYVQSTDTTITWA